MANQRNHLHKPYFSNSQENNKFSIWTFEEDKILFEYLSKYSSESSSSRVSLYTKIAVNLDNKTIRDVARRCKVIDNNENAKRRKLDHNGLGASVMHSNPSFVFAQSSLPQEEYGNTYELLQHNKQLFDQIYANINSYKFEENSILFSKSLENIKTIHIKSNEIMLESMKHSYMPPLPVNLNEEQFYALFST